MEALRCLRDKGSPPSELRPFTLGSSNQNLERNYEVNIPANEFKRFSAVYGPTSKYEDDLDGFLDQLKRRPLICDFKIPALNNPKEFLEFQKYSANKLYTGPWGPERNHPMLVLDHVPLGGENPFNEAYFVVRNPWRASRLGDKGLMYIAEGQAEASGMLECVYTGDVAAFD